MKRTSAVLMMRPRMNRPMMHRPSDETSGWLNVRW